MPELVLYWTATQCSNEGSRMKLEKVDVKCMFEDTGQNRCSTCSSRNCRGAAYCIQACKKKKKMQVYAGIGHFVLVPIYGACVCASGSCTCSCRYCKMQAGYALADDFLIGQCAPSTDHCELPRCSAYAKSA